MRLYKFHIKGCTSVSKKGTVISKILSVLVIYALSLCALMDVLLPFLNIFLNMHINKTPPEQSTGE